MKLLSYTRYLRQKIKLYDKLISGNIHYQKNPFAYNKYSTTVIWVENAEQQNSDFS